MRFTLASSCVGVAAIAGLLSALDLVCKRTIADLEVRGKYHESESRIYRASREYTLVEAEAYKISNPSQYKSLLSYSRYLGVGGEEHDLQMKEANSICRELGRLGPFWMYGYRERSWRIATIERPPDHYFETVSRVSAP